MATRTTNAQMEADLRDSVRPTWAPRGRDGDPPRLRAQLLWGERKKLSAERPEGARSFVALLNEQPVVYSIGAKKPYLPE